MTPRRSEPSTAPGLADATPVRLERRWRLVRTVAVAVAVALSLAAVATASERVLTPPGSPVSVGDQP
ncbi:MAG: hypothetical protein AAFN30_11465 [Actinomycetota bacterium]